MRMTRDDAAPLPGDLLLQAVEGMERPLFVLDEDWRFRYMNPAGAALLGRRSTRWSAGSSGRSTPRRSTARSSRTTGGSPRPGSRPASRPGSSPLRIWFQVDAFRTDGGLVVTYDDVTERRRTEEERAAAVAAREVAAAEAALAAAEAEEAGRHLMLLGDINLAMTSTLDTDEAVERFADLVVPLLADWCLVSVVDPDGTRRDVGRAHRDPALVRRCTGTPTCGWRPTADGAGAEPAAGPRPVVIPDFTDEHLTAMVVQPRGAGGARPLRPAAVAAFPLSPAARCSAPSPWSTGPSGARSPPPSCGRRRSPPAGPRWPWTTPGWRRPTSRWPSGCS